MNLKKNHKGVGGVFFIIVAFICASIMIMTISLSRASSVEAISDNIGHVIATKVAINSYLSGKGSYTLYGNPTIDNSSDENVSSYNPLNDFINMGNQYNIIVSPPTYISISWDSVKKVSTVQIGEFKTDFNQNVKPHVQEAKIENN